MNKQIALPQTRPHLNYPFGMSIIIVKISTLSLSLSTLCSNTPPVKNFRRKKFIAEPPLKISTPNSQDKDS